MPIWALSFLNHGATKATGIVLLIVVLIGGAWLWHRNGYNTGYRIGYSTSLKDNPPNVYNGPSTINQQPCPPPSIFGLSIGKIGFGFIYKK